jgi:hypothetical protein
MIENKELQVRIRIDVPESFSLELEKVYQHTEWAHRAIAFPDFVGLLVGLGLEQYRNGKTLPEVGQEETPDDGKTQEGDTLHLFDIDRLGIQNLFREFDEAMESAEQPEYGRGLRLVTTGEFT